MLDTFLISDIILKVYESIMAYVIFKFVAGVMERIVEQNLLYDFMESYLTTTRRRYMKMLSTMIYLSARLPMNTVYQGREYMI